MMLREKRLTEKVNIELKEKSTDENQQVRDEVRFFRMQGM
jgi:hypothetical protein